MILTNKNLGLGLNNNNKGVNTMSNIMERANNNKERNMAGLYSSEAETINKELIEASGSDIDCTKLDNKQKAFAVMSYSYGNLVGVTTTGVSLGLTIMTNPEQYFVNGKLNLAKIRKTIKDFGVNASMQSVNRYKSVFAMGINKEMAVNKFGRVAEFVRVSAHEIGEFETRIKSLSAEHCTVEDLTLIAKDLDVIGRAMQELAIDVTKDKSKDIGYNIMSFIQTKTKTLSRIIKKCELACTLDSIIEEQLIKKHVTSSYKMMPKAFSTNNALMLKDININSKSELADAVVMDTAGEMMEEINKGYIDGFDKLVDLFKTTHAGMYDRYIEVLEMARRADSERAVRVAHIVKCARIALYSINSLFEAKRNGASVNSDYVKEVGSKLRAGLYTEGKKYGFNQTAVVVMAIAASFCHLNGDKLIKKQVPSLTELWTIFPKEFVIDYVSSKGSDRRETIKDMLTVKTATYDLCLNDELEFDGGMAETEYGFVVIAEDYTGKAIVTEYGLQAVVDHYAYEPINIMFLSETYKRNVSLLTSEYVRPEVMLNTNAEQNYREEIVSMIKVAEQSKVASSIEFIGNKEVQIRDLVIKKGNKISIIGRVLSGIASNKIEDAIITVNGGVVFFK